MDESRIIGSPKRQLDRVHKSYFRAARWSRAAAIAFWIVVVLFFFWAVPWFPWGMSSEDYSSQVVLTVLLLGCCPAITAVTLLLRDIAAQRREALVAWASIHDRATGLRNREYFLERLGLQCGLGRNLAGYHVGLLLISLHERSAKDRAIRPLDEKPFQAIGTHLAEQTRPTDLVAVIGAGEIGALVSAGSMVSLQAAAVRVRRAVQEKAQEMDADGRSRLVVSLGVALLDDCDSPSPESLISAAQRALKPIHPKTEESTAAA